MNSMQRPSRNGHLGPSPEDFRDKRFIDHGGWVWNRAGENYSHTSRIELVLASFSGTADTGLVLCPHRNRVQDWMRSDSHQLLHFITIRCSSSWISRSPVLILITVEGNVGGQFPGWEPHWNCSPGQTLCKTARIRDAILVTIQGRVLAM